MTDHPALAMGPASRISERRLDPQSFGSIFCDHMLVADYADGCWGEARIEMYGAMALSPSISGLQYGISVFEGHKAFRTIHGDIVLFRPHDNYERMRRSCRRVGLPEVPEHIYIEGLKRLVRADRDWVPVAGEGSLYLRPCVFATEENIRVRSPATCRFVLFTCAVGQYYAEALKLLATQAVRAFPGGTGDLKPGGNYAPTLVTEQEAQRRGFQSVLWLDAREHRYVEEAGVMNIFFVIDGAVITPNLSGTILPGIMRESVLTLLRAAEVRVEERPISIHEVIAAHHGGRLEECFGTGTAATLSHIAEIEYEGTRVTLPPVDSRLIGASVLEQMHQIRTGQRDDLFGWLEPI